MIVEKKNVKIEDCSSPMKSDRKLSKLREMNRRMAIAVFWVSLCLSSVLPFIPSLPSLPNIDPWPRLVGDCLSAALAPAGEISGGIHIGRVGADTEIDRCCQMILVRHLIWMICPCRCSSTVSADWIDV